MVANSFASGLHLTAGPSYNAWDASTGAACESGCSLPYMFTYVSGRACSCMCGTSSQRASSSSFLVGMSSTAWCRVRERAMPERAAAARTPASCACAAERRGGGETEDEDGEEEEEADELVCPR